jgi:hypothetical protein
MGDDHERIWDAIEKNRDEISTLSSKLTRNDEKTDNILVLVKDISQDIKKISSDFSEIQLKQNTMDTKWQLISGLISWKTILAFCSGIGFILAALKA